MIESPWNLTGASTASLLISMESQTPVIMDIHDWIMDIHDWIMDIHDWIMDIHDWIMDIHNSIMAGVYTKFSGRLSEEPFPWLIHKFPCILIFKSGQPGCQLNLSEGQIRLDLTSGRPLV